jgi:hypothetical protein
MNFYLVGQRELGVKEISSYHCLIIPSTSKPLRIKYLLEYLRQ